MPLSFLRALLLTDPLVILSTIFMGTVSLLASFFDSTGRMQHAVARRWARMLVFLSGIKLSVTGLEKLDPKQSYVFVSNHQSLMDTPVIMGYIPFEFRFFAKRGLFKIPFIGTHLRRAGHLPVENDNPRASLKRLTEAAKLMRQGAISVLLFPEGGRSEVRMTEFREGAAYLAIKAGVPAVPVGLVGMREILPMGSVHIRSGPAQLHIGEPIPTANMTLQDRAALNQLLRERIGAMVGE